jgi:ketose-bisphosphate aldolase
MPLVNMKEMLADARKNHYSVPMFDVSDTYMIRAAVEIAAEEKSPVILGALEPDIAGENLDYWVAAALMAAKRAKIQVCVHMDHAVATKQIRRVVKAGFSSVMLDASAEEFEENIRRVREVCREVQQRGVTVEAELGHVGDGIAGSGESAATGHADCAGALTEPDKVTEFLEKTGVDALAVSIGTVHGVYVSAPKLDIERLKQINSVSNVPLVLHGGSGTPEDQLRAAIGSGICKINIFSELLAAWNKALLETLGSIKNLSSWPTVTRKKADADMREVMRGKFRLFGSGGRA